MTHELIGFYLFYFLFFNLLLGMDNNHENKSINYLVFVLGNNWMGDINFTSFGSHVLFLHVSPKNFTVMLLFFF